MHCPLFVSKLQATGLARLAAGLFRWAGVLPACMLALAVHAASAAETALWFEQGRPKPVALQAVALLAAAPADGLDPRDYDADRLAGAVAQAASGVPLPPDALAGMDGALTAAVQRYLADLHFGRIDPRTIHEDFAVPPPDRFDPAAHLRTALAQQRLAMAVREAAPAVPLYARLRDALARYRELAKSPLWQAPLPALPGRKLAPGQAWAGVPALAQRLEALGDLPAGGATPVRYEGPLIEAVRAFQERHGLAADGVIGKDTWTQLGVTPAERVRQIELTLERLRWTPLLAGPRMIVVNLPEFMLRAYEIRDGRIEVRLESKVIVGAALKTRTPLFDEAMRYVEFSPYWNVPPSIARAELVPRLRRDPGHFQQQGFEFVAADGRVLGALSAQNLDAVLGGQLRIRQRPGPNNALGDIKFVFPNNDNIYLHHTATPGLFERARRDFSHGCIRVEQPVALAKFVLQDDPDWSEARIRAAMSRGTSATLRLKEPLPVVIAYGTVIVKGGRVHFFADLYGHDRLLDAALRQRPGNAAAASQGPAAAAK